MSEALLAAPDVIEKITSAKTPRKQAEVLKAFGIPHRLSRAGEPLVLRSTVERWILGDPVGGGEPEPDFSVFEQ